MRLRLAALCLLSSLAVAQAISRTGNSQTDTQAVSLIQGASAAQSGANVIQDVQLTGTVVMHAGTDQKGTITVHADAQGRSQLSLNLDGGQRTEYTSGLGEDAACTWSSSDGTIHKTAPHNCSLPASWILPALTASNGVQGGTVSVQQTANSHDSVKTKKVLTGDADADTTARIEKVSTAELTLDPQSHLPTKLTFNIHPDNDMGRDIPVEVTYSDYRSVNGSQIPFHIEKRMNGVLFLEISIDSASLNAGSVKP